MDVRRHRRRAVSPIIATLLLIAIAVAAGIIVYVFVGGLSSSLTKSGGSQVADQLSMDAYNFPLGNAGSYTSPYLTLYVRNTGSSTLAISQVFIDGTPVPYSATACITAGCISYESSGSATLSAGSTATLTFGADALTGSTSPFTLAAAGTTHALKIVFADGGSTTFSPVAGSNG